ncbi:hypothetical protein AB0D27_24800 [Streptomyces sp. NPDC048415]|uniref:hypothetical protein n=1 Tax=Streptomyces sp. NPDC048415 TaxID=3154822 RepID=UPI003430DEB0
MVTEIARGCPSTGWALPLTAAWDVPQGILFRTAGSRYARDGERMQHYFRDAATYWTHVGPTMAEPLHRRVGRDRLGLPSDDIPLLP